MNEDILWKQRGLFFCVQIAGGLECGEKWYIILYQVYHDYQINSEFWQKTQDKYEKTHLKAWIWYIYTRKFDKKIKNNIDNIYLGDII